MNGSKLLETVQKGIIIETQLKTGGKETPVR